MFVSHEYIDKLCKIKLDDKEGKMTHLQNIVVFENDTTQEQKDMASKVGLKIYSFEQVIMKGRESVSAGTASLNEPTMDDCYMFSYTSGTTGDPKGVKLTHKMIMQCGFGV